MNAIPLRANFADDPLATIQELLDARDASQFAAIGDLATVLTMLRSGAQPRLIVLDLGSAEDGAAAVTEIRAMAGPRAALLALGRTNDVHMFRSLLAAGASDYVPLPGGPETLRAAVDRLLSMEDGKNDAPPGGQVAVIVGTRGGVGTTTAAITLGWIMSHEMSKRTALVDLDLQFGTLALALDIDPGRGLRDALEKPERIDGLYIDRAAVKVSGNLFALSAEEPADDTPIYEAASVGILLDELKRKFDWVVIDLPRSAGAMRQAVLSAATHTVIVADTTLAGLRDAIRIQALARSSNPDQRIIVLRGGALGGHGGVSRAEFEKELGHPFDATIPSDSKTALAAANAGQPLPQIAPKSPAVAALRQIAVKMAPMAASGRRPKLSLRFGRK